VNWRVKRTARISSVARSLGRIVWHSGG
jgi:hypothetical protein